MLGPFEPAIDTVPFESDLGAVHHAEDIPAMREVYLSSHTILTLSFGKFYMSAHVLAEGEYLTMTFRDVAS